MVYSSLSNEKTRIEFFFWIISFHPLNSSSLQNFNQKKYELKHSSKTSSTFLSTEIPSNLPLPLPPQKRERVCNLGTPTSTFICEKNSLEITFSTNQSDQFRERKRKGTENFASTKPPTSSPPPFFLSIRKTYKRLFDPVPDPLSIASTYNL